ITFAVCVLLLSELVLGKRDYYTVLAVPYKLAAKFHPDKNKSPDVQEKVQEILEGESNKNKNKKCAVVFLCEM
ncbi:DNJB9 protein, partial [Polypterus senegalus]|nr:DNJB9 protein [Polypterus senegalus]